MRRFAAKACLILAVLLGSVGTSESNDFENGARAYERGDYSSALRDFMSSAERGNDKAQSMVGLIYKIGQGVPNDPTQAVKWFKLAAVQGNLVAQHYLGEAYALGEGVTENQKEAVKWFELAANQGHGASQYNAGRAYFDGKGIPKNVEKALKYFTLSADQGIGIAQLMLGIIFRDGLGVQKNPKKYWKLFTLAAEQGLAPAQGALGKRYLNGLDGPKNYQKALKWHTLAAEQGDADSQGALSSMYFSGNGVIKDTVYAYMWANIAASSGHPAATDLRNLMVQVMSPSQLARAEELTRECIRKQLKGCMGSHPPIKQVSERIPEKRTLTPKSGSIGSGFFVSKLGHVVTNEHVVRNCSSVTVGDNSNKLVTALVIETDKRNDLALLRISSTQMASADTKSLISKLGLKLVPLSSEGLVRSEDVELGEDVLVSGYPYGELFSNTIKVTKGIVSANKGMGDDSGQFQMDAAVQSGNSGGPIYDENGSIVGVVVAQLNKLKVAKTIGSLPENVNFGIKASTVRQFLTSAGLPTKWSNRTQRRSTKELAKIAKNQTVMVVCNP